VSRAPLWILKSRIWTFQGGRFPGLGAGLFCFGPTHDMGRVQIVDSGGLKELFYRVNYG